MLMTDVYGLSPGMSAARETYEAEFRWGSQYQGIYANGLIDGATLDVGNTPTFELRPGLLLGQIVATGKYTNYSPTATNGSEVASAILLEAIRTQSFEGVATDRFYAVLVGGPVQGSKILGLDLMARQQMDKFMFDDMLVMQGNHWFPWKRFQTKTANYSIVASDNFTMFDTTGASGTVILTLPPIAPGYMFGLTCMTTNVARFTSNEGGNVAGSSLTNTSVSATALNGVIYLYTNPAGTKWLVEQHGTAALTFA